MLLETVDLTKTYGGVKAVEKVSISIETGKVTSLIGPNGAGKTTLFNCITGLTTPTMGTTIFQGDAVSNLKSYIISRRGIARTFQNIRLFSEMSVIDNVMVGGYIQSVPTRSSFLSAIFRGSSFHKKEADLRKRARELLDFVGISGRGGAGCLFDLPSRALSYGDKRRLEIARALASSPKLILLDEPGAGMNPKETEALMVLIGKIRLLGITPFLIEHNMKMVMGVSDHIIVLDHGVKIAEGTAREIQGNAKVVEAYLGCQKAPLISSPSRGG